MTKRRKKNIKMIVVYYIVFKVITHFSLEAARSKRWLSKSAAVVDPCCVFQGSLDWGKKSA